MDARQARIIRNEAWWNKWNVFQKAEWTRRLIKNPKAWTERVLGSVDYYMCQVLSGHGAFGVYLQRRRLSATNECCFCMKEDTAELAVFQCGR